MSDSAFLPSRAAIEEDERRHYGFSIRTRILQLDEIFQRRMEQDKRWGGAEHDDHHDELDWQCFIEKQIKQAADADTSECWRDRMVDIGALALAAIEWADRKTKEQV